MEGLEVSHRHVRGRLFASDPRTHRALFEERALLVSAACRASSRSDPRRRVAPATVSPRLPWGARAGSSRAARKSDTPTFSQPLISPLSFCPLLQPREDPAGEGAEASSRAHPAVQGSPAHPSCKSKPRRISRSLLRHPSQMKIRDSLRIICEANGDKAIPESAVDEHGELDEADVRHPRRIALARIHPSMRQPEDLAFRRLFDKVTILSHDIRCGARDGATRGRIGIGCLMQAELSATRCGHLNAFSLPHADFLRQVRGLRVRRGQRHRALRRQLQPRLPPEVPRASSGTL